MVRPQGRRLARLRTECQEGGGEQDGGDQQDACVVFHGMLQGHKGLKGHKRQGLLVLLSVAGSDGVQGRGAIITVSRARRPRYSFL